MALPRRLLFVCHGNTCRSPMAVGIARSRLRSMAQGGSFRIEGAGVAVRVPGAPADPRAVRCAGAHGIDLAWSRSRPVGPADFRDFDLLVSLDHDVTRRLHALAPAAGAPVRALLSFAPRAGADEVPDPFHGGPADYEAAFGLIRQGVDALMNTIA